MPNPIVSRWQPAAFVAANVVGFGLLCLAARWSGIYHLRLLVEAFAAAYVIVLTAAAWMSSFPLMPRLAIVPFALTPVISGSRMALGQGFAAWFEVALWFVPVVSVLCGLLRLAGYRIEQQSQTPEQLTFSIRSLLMITAAVAMAIPIINLVAHERATGQYREILWLTDALTFVIPVSMICVTIACCVLSNRLIQATALAFLAPMVSLVICYIYRRTDIWPMVFLVTATTLAVIALTSYPAMLGLRLVKTDATAVAYN